MFVIFQTQEYIFIVPLKGRHKFLKYWEISVKCYERKAETKKKNKCFHLLFTIVFMAGGLKIHSNENRPLGVFNMFFWYVSDDRGHMLRKIG